MMQTLMFVMATLCFGAGGGATTKSQYLDGKFTVETTGLNEKASIYTVTTPKGKVSTLPKEAGEIRGFVQCGKESYLIGQHRIYRYDPAADFFNEVEIDWGKEAPDWATGIEFKLIPCKEDDAKAKQLSTKEFYCQVNGAVPEAGEFPERSGIVGMLRYRKGKTQFLPWGIPRVCVEGQATEWKVDKGSHGKMQVGFPLEGHSRIKYLFVFNHVGRGEVISGIAPPTSEEIQRRIAAEPRNKKFQGVKIRGPGYQKGSEEEEEKKE